MNTTTTTLNHGTPKELAPMTLLNPRSAIRNPKWEGPQSAIRNPKWAALVLIFAAVAALAAPAPALAGLPGAEGDLYVTSYFEDKVVQFDGLTGALVGDFVLPGSGGLDYPVGLVFGAGGSLFVSSKTSYTNNITEHDGNSGTFLGPFASEYHPWGVVFGPNGNLFVRNGYPSVEQYDRTTGASLGTFACGAECGFRFSAYFAFGPNGNLFIGTEAFGQPGTESISEFDGATGVLIRTFAVVSDPHIAGSGTVNLEGVTFGPNGNPLVSGRLDGTYGVIEFDIVSGDVLGFFASGGGLSEPGGLAFGPNGNLFVSSGGTDQVLEYDGMSGAFIGPFADVSRPCALTFKPVFGGPFPQPQLTDVSPAQAGDCSVLRDATVSGTGLVAGVQLKLTKAGEPDIFAVITDLTPDTSITVNLNLAGVALGVWDLVATYPDGQTDTFVGAIDVTTNCLPPVITSFSIDVADNCDPLEGVVILGEGFVPGTQVRLTMPGETDIVAYNVDVQGPGRIEADFGLSGATLGLWDLVLTRPDGQSATIVGAMEITECDRFGFRFAGNHEFAVGHNPMDLASGDLDGDGDLDLAVFNQYDLPMGLGTPPDGLGDVSILINVGGGMYARDMKVPTHGFHGVGHVQMGDLDGDGDLDLVVMRSCNTSTGISVTVVLNNGDATFGEYATIHQSTTWVFEAIALGDLDGDGDLDLTVARRGAAVDVLLNDGSGAFTQSGSFAVPTGPCDVATGDLDGDGDLDLAVAIATQGGGGISILLNNGDATFAGVIHYGALGCPCTSAAINSVAVGDLDDDGDLDVVGANGYEGFVVVLANIGAGIFDGDGEVTYGAGDGPTGVAIADLDGDAHLDLAVANYASGNVAVLLNVGDGTFAGTEFYNVGIGPRGLTVGDVDGDGDLDLSTGNEGSGNGTVSVILNNGDGSFHVDTPVGGYVTGEWPRRIAAGDLNGDGTPDLVVTDRENASVAVLLNQGAGSFPGRQDYGVGDTPSPVAIADLDGDNDLDLIVGNTDSADDDLSVLLNQGDGTFAPEVRVAIGDAAIWHEPLGVAAGDLDGDGDSDVVTANSRSHDVSVLLNNGDATFAQPVSYPRQANNGPKFVALADLDGDGDLDVVTLDYSLKVLLNNGDGTFTSGGQYGTGWSLKVSATISDMDGDGDLDVAVPAYAFTGDGQVFVYLNNGDATFDDPVSYDAGHRTGGGNPGWIASADFDLDGDADLVTLNTFTHNLSVLSNNGDGTFAGAMAYGGGDQPSSMAIADLNGDGRPDMAMANRGVCRTGISFCTQSVTILLNRSGDFVYCPEDLAPPPGVEQQDLNAVLNRWGDPACELAGPDYPCPEDLALPDGVEQQDLNAVLNRWGDPDCAPAGVRGDSGTPKPKRSGKGRALGKDRK